MSRFSGLVILVAAVAACDQSSGAGSGASGSAGSAVATTPVKNPAGGFSADLAKKLDQAGSGADTPERTNATIAAAAADGSGSPTPEGKPGETTAAAKVGSPTPETKPGETNAAAKPGETSTKVGDPSVAAKPAETKPGETKPGETKPGETKPAETKAAETKPTEAKPGETKAAEMKPAETKPAETKPVAVAPGTSVSTAPKIGGNVVISSGTTPKAPVVVPSELKAINISLLPNWDRDVEAAGTISLAVKLPGKTDIATFVFGYGYEDAKAPADRDAYKKWLADNKIFVTKDDRQKGSAWYLEGVDGQTNKPAFRMVTVYGGKKLICYGSLYKDSSLGDLRDQTIIQAKQICETLTL